MTQRSRRKPLLQKDGSCRRGFGPEPSSSMMRWSQWKPPRQPPDLRFSMTQRSRRKPLLQKAGSCRRGFSPEPSSSMTQRVAAEAAPTASIFLAVAPLVPAGQPQAVDLHQNLRIIGGEEPGCIIKRLMSLNDRRGGKPTILPSH